MITKSFIKDGIPTVTPKDVEMMKEGTLVDVRTPDELSENLVTLKDHA